MQYIIDIMNLQILPVVGKLRKSQFLCSSNEIRVKQGLSYSWHSVFGVRTLVHEENV